MFDFFKKKVAGDKLEFAIEGMHCTSCAVNITSELEEIPGVLKVETSYVKGVVKVVVEKGLDKNKEIQKRVEELGYTITPKSS